METNNKGKQAMLSKFRSKDLLQLAAMTPKEVLVEKFLLHSRERTKTLMSELQAQKKKISLWLASFMAIPIAAGFLVDLPSHHFALLEIDFFCRLFFGWIFGTSLSTIALCRSWRWKNFFFPLVFGVLMGWNMDADFYEFLLASELRTRLFASLLGGLGAPAMTYPLLVFSRNIFRKLADLATGAKSKPLNLAFSLNDDGGAHMEELFSSALAEKTQLSDEALARLVEDFAPECSVILKNIKVQPIEQTQNLKSIQREKPQKMKLPIYIGKDTNDRPITIDLATLPHLLVGGATGWGKSNFLNHLISSFLEFKDTELILIDPEEVEFWKYKGLEGTRFVGTLERAQSILAEILVEMEKRKQRLKQMGVVKIDEYNKVGKEKFKRKIIIIDEYADFAHRKEFESKLMLIARKGRKYGIHLIVATQRPDAKIISDQIRANITTVVAFKVRDAGNAKVLLAAGAERLSEKGQCLLSYRGEKILVQSPLASGKISRRKARKEEEEEEDRAPVLTAIGAGEMGKNVLQPPDKKKERWVDYLKPTSFNDLSAQFANAGMIKTILDELGILGVPSSARKIGQELAKLGFRKLQKKIDGRPMRGYYFLIVAGSR